MGSRQRKYLVVFFMVFALTCSLLIYAVTRSQFRAQREAMEGRAREYGDLVMEWFQQTRSSLRLVDYDLTEGRDHSTDWDEMSEMLADISSRQEDIYEIYVCNQDWSTPLVTGRGRYTESQFSFEVAEAYHGALENHGAPFTTDAYYSQRYDAYCVTLSEAVYNSDGEFVCVACADCPLDRIMRIMETTYTDKGYAFLIDRSGDIINHPCTDYQMREGSSQNINSLPYGEIISAEGVKVIKDYDGKYRAGLNIRGMNTGFSVLVLENWYSVFGGLVRTVMFSLGALALGFLLLWRTLRSQSRFQAETTRRLTEAAEVAEKASNAKSAFLANMSHEIRTPIHSVLGMDEMILRESNQPEILEYAGYIRQAGNTLLELINSILDFSKLESEKMELYNEPYSLRELLLGLETMMALRAKEKDLIFRVTADEELPINLIGDETRIRQILLNLLTNAIKYTAKGQVHFVIKLERMEGSTAYLRFEVSDTGIGIRPENIDRLFLSFERIDEDYNRNIEGTGLGLSIVYRLLTLMDSKIEVDSEYGKGSTFAFTLKQELAGPELMGDLHVRSESEKQARPAEVNSTGLTLRGRVLAVDDVEMNLMVLKNFLKKTQLEVDTASSGEQALEKLHESSYDLILLDHMMPKMDGVETLNAIRERHLADGVPCIALTANATSGAQQTYLEAGFDGYLSKPLTAQQLFDTLDSFLKGADGASDANREHVEKKQVTLPMLKAAIPEMDVATGMDYCGGSEEFFFPILEEYTTNPRFAELDSFFAKSDWENYRIMVHGLKSSALMIGLLDLSEQAKSLEAAARQPDADFIKSNHPAMMEHYLDTVERLKSLFGQNA